MAAICRGGKTSLADLCVFVDRKSPPRRELHMDLSEARPECLARQAAREKFAPVSFLWRLVYSDGLKYPRAEVAASFIYTRSSEVFLVSPAGAGFFHWSAG
jgi:hypothetical protein